MKLNRASSNALHAVAFLASQKSDALIPSHLIARARGISEKFLLKVLQPLVKARLLRSMKGPNGGYRLARPASQITMLEVIEAVEGPIRGSVPPSMRRSTAGFERQLDAICREAAKEARSRLQKVRLSDLASPQKQRAPRGQKRSA